MRTRAINEQWLHPDYVAIFKKRSDKFKNMKSVDKSLISVMKVVNRNSKGNPKTAADKAADEWNRKWLKCFQKKKSGEDLDTAENMISETLPQLYNDFFEGELKIPEELLNYKKGDFLPDALDEYIDRLMEGDNYVKFTNMVQKHKGLLELRTIFDSVDDFLESNDQVRISGSILLELSDLVKFRFERQSGIPAAAKVDKKTIDDASEKRAEAQNNYADRCRQFVEECSKNKDILKQKQEYLFVDSSTLKAHNYTVDEKVIAEWKKEDNAPTDSGISYFLAEKEVGSILIVPEYRALLKNIPVKYSKGVEADRVMITGMRTVALDKYRHPLTDVRNAANHKWNIKWLKAWTADENGNIDEKTILEMFGEETENMMKYLTESSLPIPTSKEGEPGYTEKLRKWVDNMMRNDARNFQMMGKKVLAWSHMRKTLEPFMKFSQENKYFDAFSTMIIALYNFIRPYSIVEHNTYEGSKTITVTDKDKRNYALNLEISEQTAVEQIFNLGNIKDKKPSLMEIVNRGKKEEAQEENLNRINVVEEDNQNRINVVEEENQNRINVIEEDDAQLTIKTLSAKLVGNAGAHISEKETVRGNVKAGIRKKLDYEDFNDFTEFATLFGTEKRFNSALKLYADGKKLLNSDDEDKEEGEAKIIDALGRCTAIILNIDTKDFDLSSDEKIMQQAGKLEELSNVLRAYMRLLTKEQNNCYMNNLYDERYGQNLSLAKFDVLMNHLEKLFAIADYYRLRKNILTNDLFINAEKEPSLISGENDSADLKKLKKMMRASVKAKEIMDNNVFDMKDNTTELKCETMEEEKSLAGLDMFFVKNKKSIEVEAEKPIEVFWPEMKKRIEVIGKADNYVKELEEKKPLQK